MSSNGFGSALAVLGCSLFCYCLFGAACAQAAPKSVLWDFWQAQAAPVQLPPDRGFAEFLVQYRGLNSESIAVIDYARVTPAAAVKLKSFVASYIAIDPRGLTKPEQFVYWVNLYNAQIIIQILEADIPESIKDIRPGFAGLLAGGPWRKTQFHIAGQALSFNDIEHRILRPIWRDARVHFVLNCASIGCPDIPAKPLMAANLDAQLDDAAKAFINHQRAVFLSGDRLKLSSLFDWFASDFGASDVERIAFLNRYREQPIGPYLDVRYAYDWRLNAP
ncbi:DUF547 domain-containing protein [Simiduia curdlanivorans]|uniref:DUF547 domain-containing protein n=1 Tax=Simiduia curdlanivorans TaxID=1492769 RepID=A0ABV8V830_9GAMM|nr:DUF547 domain-containing protein [Simiduia curdlanivorans]MDN3639606.1 DUF547 domain-containing protein [Simiduia curdlanivorans]